MDVTNITLSKSDMEGLARLVKHGKPVWPTMCGIELDRGEFWGLRVDMLKLENLDLVQHEKVAHGPQLLPHYTVSPLGFALLEANNTPSQNTLQTERICMDKSEVFKAVVEQMDRGEMVSTQDCLDLAVQLGGKAETAQKIIDRSLPASTMGNLTFYFFALIQAK